MFEPKNVEFEKWEITKIFAYVWELSNPSLQMFNNICIANSYCLKGLQQQKQQYTWLAIASVRFQMNPVKWKLSHPLRFYLRINFNQFGWVALDMEANIETFSNSGDDSSAQTRARQQSAAALFLSPRCAMLWGEISASSTWTSEQNRVGFSDFMFFFVFHLPEVKTEKPVNELSRGSAKIQSFCVCAAKIGSVWSCVCSKCNCHWS